MVSYSLGGLAGSDAGQTTGDAAWRGVFKGDAERLQAELPPDSLLKRAFIFETNLGLSGLSLFARRIWGAR